MVLEKETWARIPSESLKTISLAGLVGDGASLITSEMGSSSMHSRSNSNHHASNNQKNGFSHWLEITNPFLTKITASDSKESLQSSSSIKQQKISYLNDGRSETRRSNNLVQLNESSATADEENEDLLADFIDEDSQLPSRISKPVSVRDRSSGWKDEEISAQTGSSICLLR